jgi:hypothetical protein
MLIAGRHSTSLKEEEQIKGRSSTLRQLRMACVWPIHALAAGSAKTVRITTTQNEMRNTRGRPQQVANHDATCENLSHRGLPDRYLA